MNQDLINVEKLMQNLPKYFNHDFRVVIHELIQNSCRAGATDIKFNLHDGIRVLEVIDTGPGIDDIIEAITVANSAWNNSEVYNQDPAGMGIYTLFAVSEKVLFRSGFGSLTIDTKRFFTDVHYRMRLKDLIFPDIYSKGLHIYAYLSDKYYDNLKDHIKDMIEPRFHREYFNYFNIDLTIGDKRYPRFSFDEYILSIRDQDKLYEFEYQGNRGYILIQSSADIKINYYGNTIEYNCGRYSGNRTGIRFASVFFNITSGSPVTPVLPYRGSLVEDDKYHSFIEFIKDEIKKDIIELYHKDKSTLLNMAWYEDSISELNDILHGIDHIVKVMDHDSSYKALFLNDLTEPLDVAQDIVILTESGEEIDYDVTTSSSMGGSYEGHILETLYNISKIPYCNLLHGDIDHPMIRKHRIIIRVPQYEPGNNFMSCYDFSESIIVLKHTITFTDLCEGRMNTYYLNKGNSLYFLDNSHSSIFLYISEDNTDVDIRRILDIAGNEIFNAYLYHEDSEYGGWDAQKSEFDESWDHKINSHFGIVDKWDLLNSLHIYSSADMLLITIDTEYKIITIKDKLGEQEDRVLMLK